MISKQVINIEAAASIYAYEVAFTNMFAQQNTDYDTKYVISGAPNGAGWTLKTPECEMNIIY